MSLLAHWTAPEFVNGFKVKKNSSSLFGSQGVHLLSMTLQAYLEIKRPLGDQKVVESLLACS